MSKEYEILRNEVDENIRKQDNLNNVIFSILGISVVCSTWYESAFFIITIIFISSILLAQIIQCRNVIYYVSTYLALLEVKEDSILWERRLQQFRRKSFGLNPKGGLINVINWLSFKIQKIIKNFGNFALATYMFVRLIQIVNFNLINSRYVILIYTMGGIAYLLNAIFTITICTDGRLYDEYTKRWREILNE